MRKVLIVFFLLLMGFCAALPYLIGYQVKNNIYAVVNTLAQNNKNINVSILEYNLGWLSSDAKIQVTVRLPARMTAAVPGTSKQQTLTETIENHIEQGPLIKDPFFGRWTLGMATIESKLYLSGFDYTSKSDDHSVMQMTTLVDFQDKWHSQFTQPALHFSIFNQAQFSSQGASGNIEFTVKNQRIDHADLTLVAKGLVFALNENPVLSEIDIDSLKYTNHSNLGNLDVWTGTIQMSLPTLVIKKRGNSQITLQESVVDNTVSSPNPNLYDFSGSLAFKNIQTANAVLPSLGPLRLTITGNNLSLAGVEALSAFFKSLHHQPMTREERVTYLNMLPKMLTPTTLITGNLAATTPLGGVQTDAALSWKIDPALPSTLQEMAQKMKATVNLRMACALVDKLIAVHDGPTATTAPAPAATLPTAKNSTPPSPAAPTGTPTAATATPPTTNSTPSSPAAPTGIPTPAATPPTTMNSTHSSPTAPTEIPTPAATPLTMMNSTHSSPAAPTGIPTPAATPPTTMNSTHSSPTAPPAPPAAGSPTTSAAATATPPAPNTPSPSDQKGPPPFRSRFDSWIQQGYVIKEGDNYVVLLKHENGLTTINGKTPQP